MDRYITLRSTDSVKYYPDNKPESFRVHLNEPLQLKGKWRVALAEIAFKDWNPDVRTECRDIYIYSSLCESAHGVGESKEPLLRWLCLRGNKKERSFVFGQYHYLPSRLQEVDSLHLYIKETNGKTASFITGAVTVTLHLKPLPFWSWIIRSTSYLSPTPTSIWDTFSYNRKD